MLHEEKPALDENLLEHFGVKGMHWGVRKAVSRSEIKTARKNVRKVARESMKEKAKLIVGKSSMEKVHQKKLDYLMHPDRPTAARLTKGETALLAVLSAPAIAGAQFNSRLIESRQREGYAKPGSNHARVRVIGR